MFHVFQYAPDGHSDAPVLLGTTDSLPEARRLVRSALGVRRLSRTRFYRPSSDFPTAVEGWNMWPPSHPLGYGCAVIEIVSA